MEYIRRGTIEFPSELSRLEDAVFNLKYLLCGCTRINYIGKELYCHRLAEDSITHSFSEKTRRDMLVSIKVIVSMLQENNQLNEHINAIAHRILNNFHILMQQYILSPENKKHLDEKNSIIKWFITDSDVTMIINQVDTKTFGLKSKAIIWSMRRKNSVVLLAMCSLSGLKKKLQG